MEDFFIYKVAKCPKPIGSGKQIKLYTDTPTSHLVISG